MKKVIYADNAATTKIADRVLNAMMPYLTDNYGNASTLYSFGRASRAALDKARGQVASLINAAPDEIVFTSGGTESDNLALRGILCGKAAKGRKRLITTAIEHPAILHTAKNLVNMGFEVEFLPVDGKGCVTAEQVANAIDGSTAIVSVMTANNEIGTIQPISEIGAVCREKGVFFHTDAVQAAGHIPIDVKQMNIDLMSMSSHKIHGPKGVGALYVRKGVPLESIITGGGHERGLRAGTENIAGIVGFGEAAELAAETIPQEIIRIAAIRDRIISRVLDEIPFTQLTGDPVNRLPGSASFTIECIEGESLILMLDAAGICASTGSACSTGSLDPSHVLMAIGLRHEIAHGSLRLSLGAFNDDGDADVIVDRLKEIVTKLRNMSPLWEDKIKCGQGVR